MLLVQLLAYRQQYGMNGIYLTPVILRPRDNFDLEISMHSALIRKCWEAKQLRAAEVLAWGTGSARGKFLYVEMLRAIVLAAEKTRNPIS